MSMHTIRVVYSPTTRRISLAEGTDNYGGATTDTNSVNIVVTGIVPDGTNFKARVDFGVQVRTASHVYDHPFILLEQDNDEWSAIIPNAILRAAGVNGRLPLQLVVANDDYVINSRNTLTFEVTRAFDGESDGSEIPPYDVPEWTIPEGQMPNSEDIHVVELIYDPSTRKLDFVDEKSTYGGSTIDCRSVKIQVSGIVPTGQDFSVRADFATEVPVATGEVVKPFVVLQQVGNDWCGMVPQPILMSARGIKKLPVQIVMRHGDTIINSRNAITLDITRAINAMESIHEAYEPYIMYRDDTWEWIEDFTYKMGSAVVYDGEMYSSKIDGNIGLNPSEHPEAWSLLIRDAISNVVYNDVNSAFTFTKRDGSQIVIRVPDLSSQHYTVATKNGLVTLSEAMSGDTATALDTGIWYILYGTYSDLNNWYMMGSAVTLNGVTSGNPSFYAPLTGGVSGQILIANGTGNAPAWENQSVSMEADFRYTPELLIDNPFPNQPSEVQLVSEDNGILFPSYLYLDDEVEEGGQIIEVPKIKVRCNLAGIYTMVIFRIFTTRV